MGSYFDTSNIGLSINSSFLLLSRQNSQYEGHEEHEFLITLKTLVYVVY